jgi:hypothetical protein
MSKVLKNVKIMKVTAYPLDNSMQNENRDFWVGFKTGFKMPAELKEEFLLPNLRNAGKGILSGGKLSYKYKPGDITCFQVKYKISSKHSVETLTFVTDAGES